MKRLLSPLSQPRVTQGGVAALEFALVALPFFLLLLGVMEFGRLMYLWNTVQEVTRNAARQAVVTYYLDGATDAIRYSAVFRTTAGNLPGSSEISDAMVSIKYLDAAGATIPNSKLAPEAAGGNITACLDITSSYSCIKFVEVSIQSCANTTCGPVAFQPMTGLFSFLSGLTLPLSTVRMPAESLGFTP